MILSHLMRPLVLARLGSLSLFFVFFSPKTGSSKVLSTDNQSKPEVRRGSGKNPLLSKSTVLRMLAEYVRSYPWCANMVVQHVYLAQQTENVKEVNF